MESLSSCFCEHEHKHFELLTVLTVNKAIKLIELSFSMRLWYHPQYFSQAALERHHHNNIS